MLSQEEWPESLGQAHAHSHIECRSLVTFHTPGSEDRILFCGAETELVPSLQVRTLTLDLFVDCKEIQPVELCF